MARQTWRYRAFNLVEVSVLVATIAIVAAMAAPRYANSLADYRVQAAAKRIAADVNLARSLAKTSSLGQSVVFNLASSSYSLPGVPGLSGNPSPYTVSLTSDMYQATLVSVTYSSGSTLSFDRFGQPSAGVTISVQSGSFLKSVVVDPNTGLATAP